MQLGFRDSLFDSAAGLPQKFNGDLFVIHRMTEAIWRGIPLARRDIMRLYGNAQVERIDPLYIGIGQFQNPITHEKRVMMMLGYDPHASLIKGVESQDVCHLLTIQDTLLFDTLSKPEFGPMVALVKENPWLQVEMNNHKVRMVGFFKMGISFAASGNGLTSAENFLRIFPHRCQEAVDVGIITLKKGASLDTAKQEIARLLPPWLQLFTHDELCLYEKEYWRKNSAIGFIFGFGTIMSLVVGTVIVYQILFTSVMNHLKEYATLKALGYRQKDLGHVVLSSAFFLAFLGFLGGFLLSLGLYRLTQSVTFIPMTMPFSKVVTVFLFIFTMCAGAGLLAIRKLKLADPAEMF